MDFIDIVARALGAFYFFASIFVIRTMALSELLDHALRMIEMKPQPRKEIVKRWLLGAGAVLTGAGGAALGVLSAWALPIFATNLALQSIWLGWAWKAFPPEDEEDRQGRRQTQNAAIVYAAVVFGVAWLFRESRLADFGDIPTTLASAVALLGLTAYLLRSYGWLIRRPAHDRDDIPVDDDDFDLEGYKAALGAHDGRHPSRIRFEVHPYRYPMVDADDGRLLGHYHFLPIEMAEKIEDWHDAYVNYVMRRQDGAATVFPSEQVEADHRRQAEAFVDQLRTIYGRDNVEGPFYLPLDDLEDRD